MADKTGGPAFPRMYPRSDDDGTTGMTLRDYFAAKAMQAMINSTHEAFADDSAELSARKAYNYSDAMLKERDK